jgi:8-oxo-dGTP diphosphatase
MLKLFDKPESLILDAFATRLMTNYSNPTPTVDVILQRDSKVLMVRRKKDPFKDHLALPGGFVNEGETVEEAMKRETMEETSFEVEPVDILGVYSDPKRDPRKHIVTVVFIGIIIGGNSRAADDAASIEWVKVADIKRQQQIAFDHAQILRDYCQWRHSGGTFWSTKRRND